MIDIAFYICEGHRLERFADSVLHFTSSIQVLNRTRRSDSTNTKYIFNPKGAKGW